MMSPELCKKEGRTVSFKSCDILYDLFTEKNESLLISAGTCCLLCFDCSQKETKKKQWEDDCVLL